MIDKEDLRTSRFKDAPWFDNEKKAEFKLNFIIVGGSGGIGGWTVFLLKRMDAGCIYVYDFDKVDKSNLGGQFFHDGQIGKTKVQALNENLNLFVGGMITPMPKYEASSYAAGIMISAFDNMEARRIMFNNWKKHGNLNKLFIDGRLSLETMQIFCVRDNKEDIANYEKYLYTEKEVPDDVCSLKQSTHTAVLIAAQIVSFYTNHMANVIQGNTDRVVPFKWEYFVPLDYHNKATS